MKKALLEFGGKMTGQEVGFSLGDPDPTSPTMERRHSISFFSSRMHSRSSSWSFTGSTRPSASDLGSSLASINPIRSVIREFVPSLDPTNETAPSPPSRTNSQHSINLNRGTSYDEDTTQQNFSSLSLSHVAQPVLPVRRNSDNSLSSSNSSNNREQPFADSIPEGMIHLNVNNGGDDPNNGSVEISDWLRWIEQNAIFFTLLIIRYAWIHRSGLLVIIGMFATYLHCNISIKNQVKLKDRRHKKILLLVILFLSGNIYFVYYVFREEKLHNCLIFMTPMLFLDLWSLVWCICITDFIIRFGTMVLKALISLCFLKILPSRKKGKYYMLLEYISQFYRTLIPTPLWFGFFSNYYDTGAVFAIIVTAGYLMIKGAVILSRARDLAKAVINFIRDKSYGIALKREDLLESTDNICPICQEEFSEPLLLRCKHVFCEDCVLQWFDRERTCPLCRACIASDPKWKDGSTAAWPQIF